MKPDGTRCTTRSFEQANSGAPLVLVAFGDYDAIRLWSFAAEQCGALVKRWQFFDQLAICSGGLGATLIRSDTAAILPSKQV